MLKVIDLKYNFIFNFIFDWELDYSNTKATIRKGNVKGSVFTWWKIFLTDGKKSVMIKILKLLSGDVNTLVNTINNKSV